MPGAPDRDGIERYLEFDFVRHFDAVRKGEEPDADHVFLLMVWYARDGADVPHWVHDELSGRFLSVLREGHAWRYAFPLPWLPAPTTLEIHSPDTVREYDVGAAVYRRVSTDPKGSKGVTVAVEQVAAEFGISTREVWNAWKALRERLGIARQRKGTKMPSALEADISPNDDPCAITNVMRRFTEQKS